MGEVFVLDDGGEVDLDFGNYESFLNICLTKDNNITTGKIYKKIEFDERQGKYLGKCVQIVPHFTTAIKEWVEEVAKRPVDGTNHRPDIVIVELGGTADDMESSPFMNALADFTHPDHCSRFMHIHVSLLIDLKSSGEVKTKPLQRSVEVTRRFGLLPDIIICRSERQISMAIKEKIANSCRIKLEQVIGVQDVTNIFRVPLLLMQQNILDGIKIRLNLSSSPAATALKNCPNILQWTQLADLVDKNEKVVKIAFVGKYFYLEQTTDETQAKIFTDAYSSVIKALKHATTYCERKLELLFVVSEHLEDTAPEDKRLAAFKLLKTADGILVPGGFGLRGCEGKIAACKFARETNKPFLGICLGMQCAAIEAARNICKIDGATSTEFWAEQYPQAFAASAADAISPVKELTAKQKIVIEMPEHSGESIMGGSMRLGRRATEFLLHDSILYKLYGKNQRIEERHRHRYEVNPANVLELCKAGLKFVGMGVDQFEDDAKKVSASSKSLLKIAREVLKDGDKKGFIQKVKKLCNRGEETGTAVRMEIFELKDHPFFVGVQYHPEYTSRPLSPSPPFLGLILASIGQLQSFLDKTHIPAPFNLFHNIESMNESKSCYLSSTSNDTISTSLLASSYMFPSSKEEEDAKENL